MLSYLWSINICSITHFVRFSVFLHYLSFFSFLFYVKRFATYGSRHPCLSLNPLYFECTRNFISLLFNKSLILKTINKQYLTYLKFLTCHIYNFYSYYLAKRFSPDAKSPSLLEIVWQSGLIWFTDGKNYHNFTLRCYLYCRFMILSIM